MVNLRAITCLEVNGDKFLTSQTSQLKLSPFYQSNHPPNINVNKNLQRKASIIYE